MKTLYGILGVNSEASAEEIEKAYERFSARLQSGEDGFSLEETNNQTVAIKEAYRTLSNPILRQRYDQKLKQADASVAPVNVIELPPYESTNGHWLGFKSIALIGLIVLAGFYFYNQNVKERERLRIEQERLRIEREHEVQMRAVQVLEERQKQNAKVQNVILDKSSSYADAQQLRSSQQQFERESYQAQQLENQRRQLEYQQQLQQKRDEENRQRQEQMHRQQQLQSEKRLLQQMERDHYGKVITY